MTATMPTEQRVPDPVTVLKRVDDRLARRAGDDPLPAETIAEFGRAVQEQIVEPLLAGTPAADPAVAAELQHKDDVITELRRIVDGHARSCDRLKADNARLSDEIEQARTECGEARAEATAAKGEARRAAGEVDLLGSELRASRDQLARVMMAADKEAATLKARIAELEAKRSSSDGVRHEHRYPWPRPGELPQPCKCGQPYPRAHLAEPREDVPATEPEPWADLFAGIRADLADWRPQ